MKLTAIDFGVVRRFGVPAGAELTTACGMEFVALLWDSTPTRSIVDGIEL